MSKIRPLISSPRLLLLLALLVVGGWSILTVSSLYGAIFLAYTNTQGGSYSDFSQTWVATQVVGEGGDPYSPAVLPRIQEAYYGHALQEDDPHRPTHPQGFYYPLYFVALTWPFALLSLPVASTAFKLLGLVLLVGGTYGYLRLLGWPATVGGRLLAAVAIMATIGGQAALGADQPSLLLFGMLMAAVMAAAAGRYPLLGVLLALTAFKPQLAALPVAALCLWCLCRPERRAALWVGALTLAAMLVGSLILLPSWPVSWIGTFSGYTEATAGSGLSQGQVLALTGLALRGGLALTGLAIWWPVRRLPFTDLRVLGVMAATLVINLAIQQPWFVYNMIFLFPPTLLLLAAQNRSLLPPPSSILRKVALILAVAPLVIYPLLLAAYNLQLVSTSDLGWPGFAGIFLVIQRVVSDFGLITMLFVYLAWLPGLLAVNNAQNEGAIVRPAPTGTAQEGA